MVQGLLNDYIWLCGYAHMGFIFFVWQGFVLCCIIMMADLVPTGCAIAYWIQSIPPLCCLELTCVIRYAVVVGYIHVQMRVLFAWLGLRQVADVIAMPWVLASCFTIGTD